ncbi:hypothetical protein X766_08580 [Mesorhizobium sp. LSJC255A00]|nr:hypothetical protein X766_08580 [Mesorhizobium sp. LSJC255A00]
MKMRPLRAAGAADKQATVRMNFSEPIGERPGKEPGIVVRDLRPERRHQVNALATSPSASTWPPPTKARPVP